MTRRTKMLFLSMVLCAGALVCFAVDIPAWRLVKQHVAPAIRNSQVLQQLEDGPEDFATLVPIAVTVWLVWQLDRTRRRQVVGRILAAIALATLLSVVFKWSVGRYRPHSFQGQTWSQTWIAIGPELRRAKQQSFFSGHTAAAFATASVLSNFYPPVKPIVYTLAIGCGAARVTASQHWVSDVYFACLAGMAAGRLFCDRRRLRDERRAGATEGPVVTVQGP